MPNEPTNFRDRLLDAQPTTPTLREEYRAQLENLLVQTHTPRSRIGGITLLVICLAIVAGEIRALIVYPGGPGFWTAALTMLGACAVVAAWIIRDLRRGKSLRKDTFKVSEIFYGAASILTVVQLFRGLRAPADPASTFGLLFMLAFLAVCATWSIANRITAATLETREGLLRIESRLADLAERLPKRPD
jgi:hypothetical protein